MENKKLLKYLLKDLSELDEMFAEKGKNSFDELEIEFIQNRVTGAKRLVELFLEKENIQPAENKTESAFAKEPEMHTIDSLKDKPQNQPVEKTDDFKQARRSPGVWVEESTPGVIIHESMQAIGSEEIIPENMVKDNVPDIVTDEEVREVHKDIETPVQVQSAETEIKKETAKKTPEQTVKIKEESVQEELKMEDDELVDIHNKRLGDSFLKEKSINDLMSDDSSKLEHKLSNRPVSSIQSAIGINDRFQYIRELFEGSADNFVKAVSDLDSMDDIKEAVDYLQTNFKWKKNDTSLKFINLIKRRFPNG